MSQLLLDIKDRIATITMNRPEKLNAFTDEMLQGFVAALEQCNTSDEVNVIVVTGAGRAFCSGGDVGSFGDRAKDTAALIKRKLMERTQCLPRKFQEITKPIIAAINGPAYGAGMDITLMCDIRLAGESAKLAETYARMGLVPGAGGAWLLPRVIGTARALEMFWTTEPVTGARAKEIGLVAEVYPDAELMPKAYAFARKIADGAPISIQTIKRLVYQGLAMDFNSALHLVASNMPVVRTSEDHQEAVAAFKEKRKPKFKGR